MKKLILGAVLAITMLSGCADKPKPTPVILDEVKAEHLLDKPDRQLMESVPAKKRLTHDMDDGQIGTVISNNNNRAYTVEWRYKLLQQYVCNMFDKPVGEVCNKGSK